MPPPPDEPQISILDTRLAEIDQRLHTIQSGLGDSEPPAARIEVPAGPPAAPEGAPDTGPELVSRLRELSAAQAGVLASMRELLGVLERLTIPAATEAGAHGPVSVSAGPFSSTDALRGFERALESLPGVRAVEVRGFEGGDRAIIDVQLS
jgi:hypothetical protein